MDTDSAYMALTDDFFNLIKDDMKEEFNKEKHYWFPRNDTLENKLFDRRTPGLFIQDIIALSTVLEVECIILIRDFAKRIN